jgi:hypothetical protein
MPDVKTRPDQSTGRIRNIPRHFGGDGVDGERQFQDALEALYSLGADDGVARLIAHQIEDGYGVVVEAALNYGRQLGPDAEEAVDVLSDEEFEVRMGRARS